MQFDVTWYVKVHLLLKWLCLVFCTKWQIVSNFLRPTEKHTILAGLHYKDESFFCSFFRKVQKIKKNNENCYYCILFDAYHLIDYDKVYSDIRNWSKIFCIWLIAFLTCEWFLPFTKKVKKWKTLNIYLWCSQDLFHILQRQTYKEICKFIFGN